MSRWIAHVDMDSFYVSVERMKDPSLKDKPMVVGGNGRRGVVASASYEARKFGVRSAMPMGQALRLCPTLIVVEPDFESYHSISKRIFAELDKMAPVVEQVSVDEAYIDFTGCERLYKSREESAKLIKDKVKEVSGLTSTVGVATNKLIAKIASDFAKPDGLIVIESGAERSFLAEQSIRKIPGIGPKTAVLYESRGYLKCQQLAEADPRQLKNLFGNMSLEHQSSARGEDSSPVVSEQERKSLSAEETFAYDTGDLTHLEELAKKMAEQLGEDLRSENLKAKTIQIKVRFPDFKTIVRAHTLEKPTFLAREIAEEAISLLRAAKGPQKLRLFGISLRNFSPADRLSEQLGFFENTAKRDKEEKLSFLKDELVKKFGKNILR